MLEGVPDVGVARQEAAGAAAACLERGLARSAAWLAQLAAAIGSKTYATSVDDRETSTYLVCKSLFDCREYDRAAHFSTDAITPRVRFLHFYSRYLSDENKRLDSMTEAGCSPDSTKSAALRELYDALRDECASERADGYLLYLYGVVAKKLNLDRLALRVLCESVRLTPWLWGAWLELASLPRDRETLDSLDLPRHCMTHFFYAHAYLEQKLADEALDAYENLKAAGFDKFTYLNAQMAVAYHDLREVDSAIATFRTVQQNDPFRLDNLDIYSHLLYVKEMRTELANLAHKVVEIDKYKVETCCIIGNYYSLRSEHQKAVVYFQRALRLNPNYLSAWILMGHEFIELQNTNAAIQSYRQAIEVNRNDYRAWNGLGQAYEILGLHGYCLYYYARAAQQRPNDSRMLVALGQAYEELNKIPNALKCYHRAHSVGDIEGMAILKLATLYDKVGMCDSAAAAYTSACLDSNTDADKGLQEAYKYLAYYHLKKNHLDDAHNFAFKCLDYEETKEEGKTLLKNIAQKKASMRDTNNPGTAEDGVEKMAETSDLSTSMKSTSTTGLNYTPYNSPPQTGISSKYKLGSDGEGSETRVGGHDCSLGGGVADGALQPVTMANLFGTWLSTWLTERGADEAVYAGYVSAILAGDEPPQDQRQELIDLLADMLEGDVEKHVQEIMEKWQECHPVEENKESASSVDVEDRLVKLLGSQSLATLTPKQCTDEEKKVKQAILSQYSQLTDDEEGGSGTDGEGTGDLVRNMNAATVAAAARERRELAKQESQRKKDKDKEDREKQKQLKEEKKEKRKTQKGERKR